MIKTTFSEHNKRKLSQVLLKLGSLTRKVV